MTSPFGGKSAPYGGQAARSLVLDLDHREADLLPLIRLDERRFFPLVAFPVVPAVHLGPLRGATSAAELQRSDLRRLQGTGRWEMKCGMRDRSLGWWRMVESGIWHVMGRWEVWNETGTCRWVSRARRTARCAACARRVC